MVVADHVALATGTDSVGGAGSPATVCGLSTAPSASALGAALASGSMTGCSASSLVSSSVTGTSAVGSCAWS